LAECVHGSPRGRRWSDTTPGHGVQPGRRRERSREPQFGGCEITARLDGCALHR
jgi:hypothetical protein